MDKDTDGTEFTNIVNSGRNADDSCPEGKDGQCRAQPQERKKSWKAIRAPRSEKKRNLSKRTRRHNTRNDKGKVSKSWISFIFVCTVVISAMISYASALIFASAGISAACFVLLAIIFIGILFDILGVAVTAADIRPFHAMASHREPGAKESLRLLGNAEKVSSFCNDVVGDICGVVSGIASASLVMLIVSDISVGAGPRQWFEILMAAIVSGLTVGGKAVGKTLAMNQSTSIVHFAGKVIYYIKNGPRLIFKRKNKQQTGRVTNREHDRTRK